MATDRPRHLPGLDRAVAAELAALTVLIAAAVFLRLRELTSVPTWTDEIREVLIGLDIAAGRSLPLTNVHTFIGALWNFLLAVAFLLFGPQPELGRLVALGFGCCTVAATYLLGRQLGGPLAGSIAAGLLAVSGAHVLVNSRIAWSHSITPLFTTLTLWLLLGATLRGGPRLALAGLACGLAVQTHITAAALLPAIGALALGWQRRWLRSRWAWLGGAGFVAGYANVLLSILLDGPRMFEEAGVRSLRYREDTGLELVLSHLRGKGGPPDMLVDTVSRLLLAFIRILTGAVDIRPTATAYLTDPFVIAGTVLFLVGLVRVTRRSSSLPLLVLVFFALELVFSMGHYEVIPNGRYLMPVIPLSVALLSYGLVECARWLTARAPVRATLVGMLAGGLALFALARLEQRLGQMWDSRQTSASLAQTVDFLLHTRGPTEPVFIDRALQQLWLDGGANYHLALRYRLRLAGVPAIDLRERRGEYRLAVNPCDSHLAVVHRLRVGEGDSAEGLLPEGATPPAGTLVSVVRLIAAEEAVRDPAVILHYRTPTASGRAVEQCGRRKFI